MTNFIVSDSGMIADSNLFVYVDCVEGPFVILQADRGGCHCLIVLGADDDDD